nr:F-box domain, leucine-rich repeat domain, L domain-like protein [Tanacetum cinerariifolium]GFA42492.1 F-box domain, leucine-rich repeat domain, L domain-like protein [Tanacetum cinerariifolium]
EEMRRLEATGTYTDDEINRLAKGGKQRGHIPGVGRVLPARATASLTTIPRRQVAGETHPQRQVAGESPNLLLGKRLNVVVR